MQPYILITRPAPAGVVLCNFLNQQGYQTFYFPTIAFAKLTSPVPSLPPPDWFIFTSVPAVHYGIPLIHNNFMAQTKFAVVGEGTYQALLEKNCTAYYPKTQWGGEGLLALPELQDVAGKKITIVKGKGGRLYLQQVLRERGAVVSQLIVYERVLPETNDISGLIQKLQTQQIAATVCTSFESICNLKSLVLKKSTLCTSLSPEMYFQQLQTIPLLVVSKRIKKLAEHLGFQTIWVAKSPSHEAIGEALGNAFCHATLAT